jgi:hypothetical protein
MLMDEADRLLARAFDDITMFRRLLALMPYTVHVDHDQCRAVERSRERAVKLLSRAPARPGVAHRLTPPRRSAQGEHL